jgi:hypothetical protein
VWVPEKITKLHGCQTKHLVLLVFLYNFLSIPYIEQSQYAPKILIIIAPLIGKLHKHLFKLLIFIHCYLIFFT